MVNTCCLVSADTLLSPLLPAPEPRAPGNPAAEGLIVAGGGPPGPSSNPKAGIYSDILLLVS